MSKQHNPGFIAVVDAARARIQELSITQYQAAPFGVLVDVREDTEWAAGHFPNAVHIGKGVIERDIESKVPDKTTQLVLYCGGGYRSALAADMLQLMGYQNVWSLDGGYRGWLEAGLPVVKD